MNCVGMVPPTTRFSKSKSASSAGSRCALDAGELARAAGLLLVRVVEGRAAGDRLAVGDPRRAGLDLGAELAADALEVDLEVQLAHAADQRLARRRRRSRTRKVGSSRLKRASAFASFASDLPSAALTASETTGSGTCIERIVIGVPPVKVSPEAQSMPKSATMSPAAASSISSI